MPHVTQRGDCPRNIEVRLRSPAYVLPYSGAVPIVLSHSSAACHSHDPMSSLGARGKCPHPLCVLSSMAGSQETFRSVCSKKDQGARLKTQRAQTLYSVLSLPCKTTHQGSTDVCWGGQCAERASRCCGGGNGTPAPADLTTWDSPGDMLTIN